MSENSNSQYGRIELAPVKKTYEEIRAIVDKHQKRLHERLAQMDYETGADFGLILDDEEEWCV